MADKLLHSLDAAICKGWMNNVENEVDFKRLRVLSKINDSKNPNREEPPITSKIKHPIPSTLLEPHKFERTPRKLNGDWQTIRPLSSSAQNHPVNLTTTKLSLPIMRWNLIRPEVLKRSSWSFSPIVKSMLENNWCDIILANSKAANFPKAQI